MKTKNKILCVLIVFTLVIISCVIYYNYFDIHTLVYLHENSVIVRTANYDNITAVISDLGNVYIRGTIYDNHNYGVNDVRQYMNRYSYLFSDLENCFIQIYDKCDAVRVTISESGGTIVTNKNEIYVFINGNNSFRTPEYFCSGYKQAYVYSNNCILLINQFGELGYLLTSEPDDFHVLADSVDKFVYEKNTDCIWLLTDSHQLCCLPFGELLDANTYYLDNILDFDICCVDCSTHGNANINTSLAYIDTNNSFNCIMKEGLIFPNDLNSTNISYSLNENISAVASYGKGAVALNNEGKVFLYGKELQRFDELLKYNGLLLSDNISAVYGGKLALSMIDINGKLMQFGYYPDESFVLFEDYFSRSD